MTTMAAEMHTFAVETLFPIIGRVRKTDEIVQALEWWWRSLLRARRRLRLWMESRELTTSCCVRVS